MTLTGFVSLMHRPHCRRNPASRQGISTVGTQASEREFKGRRDFIAVYCLLSPARETTN